MFVQETETQLAKKKILTDRLTRPFNFEPQRATQQQITQQYLMLFAPTTCNKTYSWQNHGCSPAIQHVLWNKYQLLRFM